MSGAGVAQCSVGGPVAGGVDLHVSGHENDGGGRRGGGGRRRDVVGGSARGGRGFPCLARE